MKIQLRHMKRLEQAFFKNLSMQEGEYGAPGLDIKRPFGNSFVEGDVLEIIGWKPIGPDAEWSEIQLQYARDLYRNLIPYLQEKYVTESKCKHDSYPDVCFQCTIESARSRCF